MMRRSLLAPWSPTVAVEISAHRVAVASMSVTGGRPVVAAYHVQALPPGAVAPSLTGVNITDRGAVEQALTRLFAELPRSPKRVALVVPDSVAKVSLVRLESAPAKASDLAGLIQFHVRKAAPFRIEEAQIAYSPGAALAGGGREFVVSLSRRSVIEEYEGVCSAAGAHAGLVDLATFNLANVVLASPRPPSGDWLLVHVAPDFASLVILRGTEVIFFRNRVGDGTDDLSDLVHQTAMYYEDRLEGRGFERVLLAGWTEAVGSQAADLRRRLETRLGTAMEPIDPRNLASFGDRIGASPRALEEVAPLVGILLRDRAAAAAGTR